MFIDTQAMVVHVEATSVSHTHKRHISAIIVASVTGPFVLLTKENTLCSKKLLFNQSQMLTILFCVTFSALLMTLFNNCL